jgi:lactate dehydrogenase-like 2-hydroxyacid dehydrogenase
MPTPRVWITGPVAESALAPLREVADLSVRATAERPGRAELLAGVRGLTGLLPVNGAAVDAAVLAAAGPELRIVANFGVGYDNIDVPACTAAGVMVTNTPDVLTEATADTAFGLILAAARRFGEGMACARADRWQWAQGLLWGQDVGGAALGILGMGRIGAAVARRALGFRMPLLYHSRRRKPELEAALGLAYRSFEELFAEADILSLHCALTAETRQIVDAGALALMKPTAILVNTGRGGLVDQAALLAAVRAGRLAGAGLDVTDPEPPAPDDPILHEPRIVVTPHLGSASWGGRTGMTRVCVANLVAALQGQRPGNLLNPEVLPG